MILSMTGFGRASESSPQYKFTVDIKSLNSKQLDLMMRVPPAFREAELDARSVVAAKLERGKVDLTAQCERIDSDTSVKINAAALSEYKAQLENIASTLGIQQPHDWYSVLLRLPDVMKQEASELDKVDIEAFISAVGKAADALIKFRVAEGRKLYDFLISKISAISSLLSEVEPFEQERVPRIRQRLEEQLVRLSSIEFDKGRLEQELIFYIEKLDVTEEKTRLKAHINYFLETMGPTEGPLPEKGQGKKLSFIAQEMGREINTLGSKANHHELQKIVVMMKDELEQIKEQVLNVL